MLEYDFMINAFLASGIVALVAGAVGYFMVLRGQTFAGHALSHVGFAGATGAALIGVPPIWGLLGFTLAAGMGMGALGQRLAGRDVAPRARVEARHAPAMALRRAGDELPAREAQSIGRTVQLRQIADGGIAAPHRSAENLDASLRHRRQAEDGAHQRRLARPVGAEDAYQFTVAHRDAHRIEDAPAAEIESDVVERDRGHWAPLASA